MLSDFILARLMAMTWDTPVFTLQTLFVLCVSPVHPGHILTKMALGGCAELSIYSLSAFIECLLRWDTIVHSFHRLSHLI